MSRSESGVLEIDSKDKGLKSDQGQDGKDKLDMMTIRT